MSAAPTTLTKPPESPEPPEKTTARPAPAGPGLLERLRADPRLPLVVGAFLLTVAGGLLAAEGTWPTSLVWDIGSPLEDLNNWLVNNRDSHWIFLYFLLHISNAAESSVDSLTELFTSVGWVGVTLLGTLVAWYAGGGGLRRSALRTGGTALGVFLACGFLGMWESTMETLALMTVAVSVAALLGLLLGLASGLSDRFERLLRPVFDTMQVMPAFAYLLPFVLLFDIGVPSALIATVIYAAPPMARLTSLGLRNANPSTLEASASLGASSWQRLITARVPLARKEMMLGLNQTIMMCLSMVVLASVVGSGGLGDRIYQALGRVNVGQALTAGIAIVLLAVLLDRTTAAAGARIDEVDTYAKATGPTLWTRLRGWPSWALFAVLTAALAFGGRLLSEEDWPREWRVNIASPVNDFTGWFESTLGSGVPVFGGTIAWADNFAVWVLNPLRSGLIAAPWWSLLVLVAVLAWTVGRLRAAVTATLAMAATGVIGLWDDSLNTLSQVLLGLLVTLVLGFLIGILAARVERVERLLRPVLDTMQTMPQFVYLIPVIALFGAGRTAGIAAAVVFVLPPVIRITTQGIRQVDAAAVEASRSMGATGWQQLRQVQLPLARGSLLVAVNQGVVLVLSMVVIAGMVGGGALGNDVITGLSRGDLAIGLPAGIAIVCLGVMLDRLTQPANRRAAGR